MLIENGEVNEMIRIMAKKIRAHTRGNDTQCGVSSALYITHVIHDNDYHV